MTTNRQALKEAVRTGDWSQIDVSKVTLDQLMFKDINKNSLITDSRINKTLHKFPKEFIGENGILWSNPITKAGVLWLLASEGSIHIAPKKLITKEILVSKNPQGTTLLHYLATYDNLKHISDDLLTRETLLVKNSYNHNPLDSAAFQLRKFVNSPPSPSLRPPLYMPWSASSSPMSTSPETQTTSQSAEPKIIAGGNLENITRLKNNVSLIFKKLSKKDLEKEEWADETLPLIKEELLRRKVIKEISKSEMSLEI